MVPPLHRDQGLEVFLDTDAKNVASMLDTKSTTSADNHIQSGRQPDFFVDDDEYFEFYPRTVRTTQTPKYPRNMGDVERLAGFRPESIHVEFPNSLHGLLAWTVTIEGTDILQEEQETVVGLPGVDSGPWLLIPNNVHTPSSRHLQGAYSALSDRVGRWPKTNEEAQQLIDQWSANSLVRWGVEIPGLIVASAVEVASVQDIISGLQKDGVEDYVAFGRPGNWRIMSYAPGVELATVTHLDTVRKQPINLDIGPVGLAGGA